MKRFLSTLLVLCLMLSLMPAAAFAADSGFYAGGECEGTVTITGGDVTAKTGSIYNRFGQAIGYQYYAAVRAYNS